MKRIRGLDAPTPGLAAYLACEGDAADWDGFRSHAAGASYRELLKKLMSIQHGLCAYCEIDLRDGDHQIEHVVPRSEPNRGEERSLDVDNLIACCKGGSARNEFGPDARDDSDRFLQPSKRNISCGEKKGGDWDADFVDPRTLPALPSLLRVGYDGRVKADQAACEAAEQSAETVSRTIETLGLNVPRLRVARERRWRALEDSWREHLGDPEVMEEAARGELLPQADDGLPRFFTTSRSYFAPWGELILEQEPREWI